MIFQTKLHSIEVKSPYFQLFPLYIDKQYYLSLTATRSTEDENPCSASSDFPAIFVASIPCANASSHGAVPFGTVAVGAVNGKKQLLL